MFSGSLSGKLARGFSALMMGALVGFNGIDTNAAAQRSSRLSAKNTPRRAANRSEKNATKSATKSTAKSAAKNTAKKPAKQVAKSSTNSSTKSAAKKPAKQAACSSCEARAAKPKRVSRRPKAEADSSCYPAGYVHPSIRANWNAAQAEMRRAGIRPRVTSTWRSSERQASLHRCSESRRCRLQRGIYGANPPGHSAHEAGFAIDLAGIATTSRGGRKLTPQGKRIVAIMRKHGFSWRYGLADPAHFEIDPRTRGFSSLAAAIEASQSRCEVRLAEQKRARRAAPARSKSPAASRSTAAHRRGPEKSSAASRNRTRATARRQ